MGTRARASMSTPKTILKLTARELAALRAVLNTASVSEPEQFTFNKHLPEGPPMHDDDLTSLYARVRDLMDGGK